MHSTALTGNTERLRVLVVTNAPVGLSLFSSLFATALLGRDKFPAFALSFATTALLGSSSILFTARGGTGTNNCSNCSWIC